MPASNGRSHQPLRPHRDRLAVGFATWAKRFVTHWRALLGWTILALYIGWNINWLAQGRLAPSLLVALTGVPAPTTGGMRAFRALGEGEWRESLRANPFAVPIAAIFVLTLGVLLVKMMRGRRLQLSNTWMVGWAALLVVAWIAKFLGDPYYW